MSAPAPMPPVRISSLLAGRTCAIASGLMILLPAATVPVAAAADFSVTTQADSADAVPGDGFCADADGACSLRAAVQEANALAGADRIALPAGHYLLSLAGVREDAGASGDLDVHDALTIAGAGTDTTAIDGNAADTVIELHADASEARLEGVTITNGLFEPACTDWSCAGAAGAMVHAGVVLTLRHVDFRGNRATRSNTMSAVLNHGCIDGDHVRVIDNGALDIGGLVPLAPFGGALEAVDPPPCITLDHGEFSGNVGNYAGAMYMDHTRLTLRRSLVAGNVAQVAGAFIFNVRNDVLLENVAIVGNRANSYGALLHDGHSDARLNHVTITGNEAYQTGGIAEANTPEHALVLSNTMITGNRIIDAQPWDPAPDCAGDFVSSGGVLIGSAVWPGPPAPPPDPTVTQCEIAPAPGDQFGTPLALGELADHGGFTRTILPVGSAIDAGMAEACTPTDQRDLPRPVGAGCDIGAVELGAMDTIFIDGFEQPASGASAHP